MTTYDPDAFNALEASGWDQKADAYARTWAKITAQVFDKLLDAAGVGKRKRVLDVGTGPGELAARAAARGADVIGIDQAAGMVALARRTHPDVDFRGGNAERLPFANAGFDAVLASFVLLHIGRQERALEEFARVLCAGGRVALTLWSPHGVVHTMFLEAMAEVGVQLPPELPAGPPFVRPDEEIAGMLERAGFRDVRVEHVRFTERFASPAVFRASLLEATVRMGLIIEAQPENVRQRLFAAVDRRLAQYVVDDQLELPVVIQLVSGVKP